MLIVVGRIYDMAERRKSMRIYDKAESRESSKALVMIWQRWRDKMFLPSDRSDSNAIVGNELGLIFVVKTRYISSLTIFLSWRTMPTISKHRRTSTTSWWQRSNGVMEYPGFKANVVTCKYGHCYRSWYYWSCDPLLDSWVVIANVFEERVSFWNLLCELHHCLWVQSL